MHNLSPYILVVARASLESHWQSWQGISLAAISSLDSTWSLKTFFFVNSLCE